MYYIVLGVIFFVSMFGLIILLFHIIPFAVSIALNLYDWLRVLAVGALLLCGFYIFGVVADICLCLVSPQYVEFKEYLEKKERDAV